MLNAFCKMFWNIGLNANYIPKNMESILGQRLIKFGNPCSNQNTAHSGVKSDSIAIDWMGRNLYWVDGVAGQILAVRLTSSIVKAQNYIIVVDKDLHQPRSLVLLPQKG